MAAAIGLLKQAAEMKYARHGIIEIGKERRGRTDQDRIEG